MASPLLSRVIHFAKSLAEIIGIAISVISGLHGGEEEGRGIGMPVREQQGAPPSASQLIVAESLLSSNPVFKLSLFRQ